MENLNKSEVQEIALTDPGYPKLLGAIRKPPKTFRISGSLPPDTKIIAISGSRETTQQAPQTAYRIGKMLAKHGYTIVTGLAEGCDEAAVKGALSAGGNVVGVVPCGLKALRSQPRKRLAHQIFATGGAVISEYPDNFSKVFPRHYLRRNEIITDFPKKRSLSQLANGQDRQQPQIALLSRGALLSLRHMSMRKLKGQRSLKILGNSKTRSVSLAKG